MMVIFRRWILGPLLLACLSASIACGREAEAMTKEHIRSLITKELTRGTRSDLVEAFFKRHDLNFDYDRFANGYQGLVRVSQYHAITIYIYLDADKKFARAEVEDSFTGP